MLDLKTFCSLAFDIPNMQPSIVVYLSVIDMHADRREAMEAVVSKLHSKYETGVTANSLVVVRSKNLQPYPRNQTGKCSKFEVVNSLYRLLAHATQLSFCSNEKYTMRLD